MAYEVAAGMLENHPMEQVRFVGEVEKAKKKLIMSGNSKSRICNFDEESFYPFTSRTWIRDS